MKKIHRFLSISIVLVISVLILCSCQESAPVTNEPVSTTEANVNPSKISIGAYSTETLNPLLVKSGYNEQVNLLIYDGLYQICPNYEATENLASGFEIENGGYTVKLFIKPNVRFHDGSQLSAYDVKATIDFLLNNPGYYSYQVRNIESVKVADDYTVLLKLSELTPNLKLQLTFPILCKKELLNTTNFQLNGTGPYRVSSQTQGKQMILELNKEYHASFSSDIKQIEVCLIPDRETIRSLSGSGILDVFYAAFFDEGLKTITKYQSEKFDFLTDEYTFLSLNYNTAYMQEKKFRKALYKAISRDSIRDDIFMSHAESTYLPLPPGSWAYNDSKENKRDIEDAKRLLSELGYSDSDNNGVLEFYLENEKQELVLDILTTQENKKKDICSTLLTDFKEIGITLNIHTVAAEEFETVYAEKKHDLYLITTNVGYDLDLKPFFDGVFSAPLNIDYKNFLSKLANADKLELKQPEYMRLCDEFYEQIPHIPLVFLKNTLLTTSKLKTITEISPYNLYYSIIQK